MTSFRNRRFCSAQRGQMSIEFMVVIGLAAMVLAGFIYYLSQGRMTAKVTDAVAGLTAMTQKTQGIFRGQQAGYAGVTAKQLIDNGAVPDSMVNAGAIASPFGAPVTVAPANIYGGTSNAISFTFQGVPTDACSEFVTGAVSGFVGVKVGTKDVRVNGANTATYVNDLASGCAANPATVVFTASR